ncbi:HBL011Cp [Eremothecium sinecaudum]|uniref:E3 ubiquitin-protein ligase PEP5 n=1 Tax=Eremothecium sinecaudum TaxID=45286 RepID=A0A125RDY1_9SACH|nr:HBL011Cp [Eremothecium sinecaudum]AMD18891.1 HBL011Cp [Eremothecium sinecaudum]
MSFTSQRQFQLFESTPIKDPYFGSESPLYSDTTLSAVAPLGNGVIATAVKSAYIQVIDLKTSSVISEFKAFSDNFQITYMEHVLNDFLVSVGECVGQPSSIKVWNLQKKPKSEFEFHTTCTIKNGNNTFPISAISISSDLSCIVIGFVNGRIILVRGDLYRDRGSRQRVIYEDANSEPITGLFLRNDNTLCFTTTPSKIQVFRTTGRNNGEPERILNDRSGADLNCSYFNKSTDELLCCLNDSIDFYKATGEKRSLVMDVPLKKRVFLIDSDHILLVCGVSSSNITSLSMNNPATVTNRLLLFDVKNKIIAMNLLLASNIVKVYGDVINDTYSTYLVTTDGVINKITEKSVEKQIKIITQREEFSIALQVAEQHSASALRIQEIRKQYGDYLYKKNLKEEAVAQYVQCLDVTESSEIISKFGIQKSSRADDSKNLATYIWSMIKQNNSNADHVTLLLIILIKLKDTEGLVYFISHFSRTGEFIEAGETESEWLVDDESYFYSDKTLFDLDTILQLLKDSTLDKLAFKLVHKFSKDPLQIVDVILNTLDDPHSALKYIKTLHIDDTLRVMIEFSKILLQKLPNDTNALLIEVFTGRYQRAACKVDILQEKRIISLNNPVFHSYKAFVTYMNLGSSDHSSLDEIPKPTYHPPKPSLVFPSFIDRPYQFVVFLEACLESYNKYQGFVRDKQEILTTLYDVYLSLANSAEEDQKQEWYSKAMGVFKESERLLSNKKASKSQKGLNSYSLDNSLMMLIAHINNVDLYSVAEKGSSGDKSESSFLSKGNLANVFRSMCLTRDAVKCMRFLEKYGKTEPELYRMALNFFLTSPHIYNDIGGDAVFKRRVLDKVVSLELMQPLDILQSLSQTNVATFGLVKDFLVNHIKCQQRETENNEKLINSYQSELQEKRNQLSALLNTSDPIQVKVKNNFCKMCHTSLDLPVVFFKCGHIFHQRCLSEESDLEAKNKLYKCPNCAVEMENSVSMAKAQRSISTNVNLLKAALYNEDNHRDRFKVVSEFIGKGGLETPIGID